MSAKQPGGVAGRVIEKLELRAKGAMPETEVRYDGQLYGAEFLHAELSREARAILAEETFTDSDGEILRSPDGELAEMWFTRLGLNLEAEDGGE